MTKETRQNEKAHVFTCAQNLVSALHLKKRNHNIDPISRESARTSPFKATSKTPHENTKQLTLGYILTTTKGYKKHPRREYNKNYYPNDVIADIRKIQPE